MKPWIIYARVSTDDQTKGVSMGVQRESCANYLRAQGINEHVLIEDDGYSAWSKTHMQRPGIQRILRAIEERSVGGVAVWAFDRFMRRQRDLTDIIDRMTSVGIGFVCVTMRIDTAGPMGDFLVGLFGGLAQLESKRTSERVKAAASHIKSQGGFWGGPVPVGFKPTGEKGKKRLVLDPATAPVMAKLWPMVSDGASLRELVTYLNDSGVRAYHGKAWATNSVSSYLRNQNVVGHIVTRAEFDRAIATLEARPSPRRRGRKPGVSYPSARAGRIYLLTGLAFCAHCKAALVGSYGTGRKGPVFYYRCGSANRRGKAGCSAGMIPARLAEEAVLRAVHEAVERDDGREIVEAWSVRAKAMAESRGPLEQERQEAALAHDEAQGRVDRLIESLAVGGAAARAVQAGLERAQLDLEGAEVRRAGIDARLAAIAVTEANAAIVHQAMRDAVARLAGVAPEDQANGLRSMVRACWLAIDRPSLEIELVVDPPRFAQKRESGGAFPATCEPLVLTVAVPVRWAREGSARAWVLASVGSR